MGTQGNSLSEWRNMISFGVPWLVTRQPKYYHCLVSSSGIVANPSDSHVTARADSTQKNVKEVSGLGSNVFNLMIPTQKYSNTLFNQMSEQNNKQSNKADKLVQYMLL